MKVCFFDDEKIDQFYPLTFMRPISFLRVGIFPLYEKVVKALSVDKFTFISKDYLNHYYDFAFDENEEYLFINSRMKPTLNNISMIKKRNEGEILFLSDNTPGVFQGKGKELVAILDEKYDTKKEKKLDSFEYIWNLIYSNEELLKEDFKFIPENYRQEPFSFVHYLNPEWIKIHPSVKLEPGVVLDARSGPIVLDENVNVMANSVIKGPVYIGKNSLIKANAKLYGHISIGPVCKIGGEVAECIIQGYTNKQHDGFLGHAYIGEWCNLGADTNNSDLKNDYGEITAFLNGKPVKTGLRFLGLIMGDHSKSAINTSFNTGTIVGINANIFARGFVKKFVPSFSWMGDNILQKYHLNKAIEVAKIVMARRNVEFSRKEEELFKFLYRFTDEVENKS